MADNTETSGKLALHWQILIAMVIGSVIGVLVNSGDQPVDQSVTASIKVEDQQVRLVEQSGQQVVFEETFSSIEDLAEAFPQLAEALGTQSSVDVEITDAKARVTRIMSGTTVSWQRKHNGNPAVSTLSGGRLTDYWQTFLEERPLTIGDRVTLLAKTIGDLFLRMLKMVTVPLILTSLITGVTGLGSQGRFGQLFGRTIFYYMGTSLLAITTGLILVNLIQPGVGAVLPGGGEAIESADKGLGEIIYNQILRLLPTNPFAAVAGGEFLSIISFAILLGMFINFVGGEHGERLSKFFESAFAVMMKMTSFVISLAPIGVAGFMIYATSTQGLSVFATLAWYMLTVFLALMFHATVVLPIVVRTFGRRNPLQFAQHMSPALLTAFSTASSNATLPLTINCVEKRAGVSNQTSSFVLPLGATINMDGTALYEVVAVLFIAQATGMEMTATQQIIVAFTALIASVGAAGIPHAGLVMMAIVLQAVGLPLEAQGIIIAVDRVLDMCRTAVNVWSDSCGCAVVDKVTQPTESAPA